MSAEKGNSDLSNRSAWYAPSALCAMTAYAAPCNKGAEYPVRSKYRVGMTITNVNMRIAALLRTTSGAGAVP
jgi:hypothetical protein